MAKPDLSVFGQARSFSDYDRENKEFMRRRALEQQGAMREQQEFAMEAEQFELDKQRAQSGGFTGNAIQAQLGNKMQQLGYSDEQIIQALTMKGVPLQDGGYATYSPANIVGAPAGRAQTPNFNPSVPNGAGAPAMPRPQVNYLAVPGAGPRGTGLANQMQDVLERTSTGMSGPVPIEPRNAPVAAPPTPSRFANGVTEIVQPNAERAGPRRLSATEQKEFYEAQDLVNKGENVITALEQALAINNKAYSGYGAVPRAVIASNWGNFAGGVYPGADATVDYNNIITGSALENLKSTFGGAPTEGERQILLEIQASANKTPAQRKAILDRAIELARRRNAVNQEKMQGIASGDIYSNYASPEAAATAPSTGGAVDWQAYFGGSE